MDIFTVSSKWNDIDVSILSIIKFNVTVNC